MTKLAYRQKGLRSEDIQMHRRAFHEADGVVVDGECCAFREMFAQAVAERILKDWDKFVVSRGDGDEMWAYINIQEIKDENL